MADPAPRPPRWPTPGCELAVASPAGPAPVGRLRQGLAELTVLAPGARLRVDLAVLARQGHLAGDDPARARHLTRLMTQGACGAVLSARGGFGSSRLLDLLPWPALVAAGKPLVGFSDLTCLLNALGQAGLVGLHGPVVTQIPRLDQDSRADLAALLAGRPPFPGILTGRGLAGGRADGRLWGGNLTMLCHLAGTRWFPPLAGAILFLEDLNEPPYRLDRLITQLELAGAPGLVAGVALGSLSENEPEPPALLATVTRRLLAWGKPLVVGLPFGHGAANRLLPVGAMARLDGAAGTLTVGLDLG